MNMEGMKRIISIFLATAVVVQFALPPVANASMFSPFSSKPVGTTPINGNGSSSTSSTSSTSSGEQAPDVDPLTGLLTNTESGLMQDPKTGAVYSYDQTTGMYTDTATGETLTLDEIRVRIGYTGGGSTETAPAAPEIAWTNKPKFVYKKDGQQKFKFTITNPVKDQLGTIQGWLVKPDGTFQKHITSYGNNAYSFDWDNSGTELGSYIMRIVVRYKGDTTKGAVGGKLMIVDESPFDLVNDNATSPIVVTSQDPVRENNKVIIRGKATAGQGVDPKKLFLSQVAVRFTDTVQIPGESSIDTTTIQYVVADADGNFTAEKDGPSDIVAVRHTPDGIAYAVTWGQTWKWTKVGLFVAGAITLAVLAPPAAAAVGAWAATLVPGTMIGAGLLSGAVSTGATGATLLAMRGAAVGLGGQALVAAASNPNGSGTGTGTTGPGGTGPAVGTDVATGLGTLIQALQGFIEPKAGGDSEGELTVRILNIINMLLALASGFLAFAFVWTGLLYIFSMGNEEQATKAKKNITSILTGLVILLFTLSIITIVRTLLVTGKFG